MSNFEIHELTEKAINRNSNIIHDTLYGEDYETGKDTAGAVADLALEVVASMYDDTASYAIGSYCIYSGVLYRCTTATTGAFDVSDWTAVLITGEYKRVRVMHKAEFDLLTPEEQADGMIFVDDVDITADDISYSAGVSVADKIDDVEAKIPSIIEVNSSTSSNLTANNITTVSFTVNVPAGYKIVSIINTTYSSNFLMDVIRIEDGDGSRTVRVNVWSNTTYSSQNLSIRAICANNLILPT